MSPHPRPRTRPGTEPRTTASLLLVAALVALLTVTGLAGPAEARGHGRTAVTGWRSVELVLTQGEHHVLRLRLRGPARAGRTVVLQATDSDGGWAPAARSTTRRDGTVSLEVPTASPWSGGLRATVLATRRARGLVTTTRTVVVRRTAAAGTPAPPPATSPGSMTAAEAEVLRLVNEARAVARTCGGTSYPAVAPVRAEPRLTVASRDHARDMAEKDYFSHTSADGRSPWDRARAAGYTTASGENIAAGYSSPASVVSGWLGSPGHCRNIMAPGARELGVGMAQVQGSRYGTYWVQLFGRG